MNTSEPSKRVDTLLEFYKEAGLNVRAFVDLRFKHFTTYMLATGLLATAAFNLSEVVAWRPYIELLALTLTVLFWLIDHRTGQYLLQERQKFQILERVLNEGAPLVLPAPARAYLRSSTATNLVFALFLLAWVFALVAHYSKPMPSQPGTTQPALATPQPSSPVAPAPPCC